ncbi:hypothetical protein MKX03_033203, partial [Papaver bracteatum]
MVPTRTIAASSTFSPANYSPTTKISVRSDNVIPLCMKSSTKPAFRGISMTTYIYRQNFTIRSFEIGPNQMATIGALLNHLQDSIANNVRAAGLLGDGFGATPEMTRRNYNTSREKAKNRKFFNLISLWVVAKMQVLVNRYPAWGDAVQIDNWFADASVKNGIANHWLPCDANTGETLAQANNVWIMMIKKTRKVSKFPEEVRGELAPITLDIKLSKLHDNTADFVQTGLT